jgi:hypothetical protein
LDNDTLRFQEGGEAGDPQSRVGALIGNYRTLEEIGRGGMGAVYRAEQVVTTRPVAIKVLLRDAATKREAVQRFFDEARATARLKHPALVDIYDCGVTPDGDHFIVMELLEGETLEELASREGALSARRAVEITRAIVAGLVVAHEAGIVHRDLKPSNVFLARARDGEGAPPLVKILDFGIAKLSQGGQAHAGRTRPGTILGTPLYMAPEQCRGLPTIDGRADVYSVGCILYRLVCAGPPFRHEGAGALIAAHQHEQPTPPRMLNAAVPRRLDALVMRLLSKAPEERPDAAGLLAELDRLLPRMPDEPPQVVREAPAPRPPHGRRNARAGRRVGRGAILAGAVAIGALGAGALGLRSRPAPPPVDGRRQPAPASPASVPASPLASLPASPWKAQMIGPGRGGLIVHFQRAVAGNRAGQVVATWAAKESQGRSVWANVYDRSRGWGRALRIARMAGDEIEDLAVAISPAGEALAFWTMPTPTPEEASDLWVARYAPGRGWTEAQRLASVAGNAEPPQLSVDARGVATVVWRDVTDGNAKASAGKPNAANAGKAKRGGAAPGRATVWVSSAPAGGPWTRPERLAPRDHEDVLLPRLGGDGGERVIASWMNRSAGGERLHVVERQGARGWRPLGRAFATSTGQAEVPEVAFNRGGDLLAAWRVRGAGGLSLWAAGYAPGRGWSAPLEVAPRQGRDVGSPQIGLDRDGNGLLVWREPSGGAQSIFARPYDARTGWGEATPIEDAAVEARHAELALSEDGRATVTWMHEHEDWINLWATSYDRVRGFGKPVPVQTEVGRVFDARITYAGEVPVVVWVQEEPNGLGNAWAATLEAAGPSD